MSNVSTPVSARAPLLLFDSARASAEETLGKQRLNVQRADHLQGHMIGFEHLPVNENQQT